MCRYTVLDLVDNYAYQLVINGYHKIGDIVVDSTDGHPAKILLVEGGAYNGRK